MNVTLFSILASAGTPRTCQDNEIKQPEVDTRDNFHFMNYVAYWIVFAWRLSGCYCLCSVVFLSGKLWGSLASRVVCSTPNRAVGAGSLARVKLCCSWEKCFTSQRISPPHCMNCTWEVVNTIQQNINKNKNKIMKITCDRLPPEERRSIDT